jgi:uncharacterized protein YPO0396
MHSNQFELNFVNEDALAGFRLHRFELLNWGTFDKHIWQIQPNGDNALLTGDIGSGKSTLIDALTTLLVPAQKIIYNKAAGAESKERNLTSYIRGHYKSEKDEEKLSARQVALRDNTKYSVLLGYFYNAGYDTKVSLAQVFWCKDDSNQPERFYLISETELFIATDFSQVTDMSVLKKRLRHRKDTTLFDSFSEYSAEFCRRLGIENKQALDLFYQTVSMKAIGNLTDFVRQQMLEEPPVQERVTAICKEFDNLNRAHQAVLKAKDQLDLLKPLISDLQNHKQISQQYQEKSRCRHALEGYFAALKTHLLQQRTEKLQQERDKNQQKLTKQQHNIEAFREHIKELERSIYDNGGRRLAELDKAEHQLQSLQVTKKRHAQNYAQLCQQLELNPAIDSDRFYDNQLQAQALQKTIERQQAEIDKEKIDAVLERDALNKQASQLTEELSSLRMRRSNIPLSNLQLRQQLCDTIGLGTEDLPFVGELLKVDETETQWEGAIERVLHNFALSLLVPEAHYAKVAHYVEKTNLKGRLVYFRVRAKANERFDTPSPEYVFHKIRIQTNSEFYDWLAKKITQEFDYVCASLDDFRHSPKAITVSGQIKSGAERHEKDDRHNINDRSRFVLGWDNAAKIHSFEKQLNDVQTQGLQCLERLKNLDKRLKDLITKRDTVRDLLNINQFTDIDWHSITQQIDKVQQERRTIQQSSDKLAQLETQLNNSKQQLNAETDKEQELIKTDGKLDAQLESSRQTSQACYQALQALSNTEREFSFPKLKLMQAELLADARLTVENCDKYQKDLRDSLQGKMDSDSRKLKQLNERIITQMQRYKDRYPQESRDVNVSLDSATEFSEMLAKLEKEDLPRHEQRFHAMLKEGTIQQIAMFQANLDKEHDEIKEKLTKINQSLNAIDYNAGTYITLLGERSKDEEIRAFQQDLKACLADALSSEDNLYDEHKFHQVKKIIDRFNGREGSTDADKKWTRKVTDVRNWFIFSIAERWRDDNQDKEYYSDSAGKSGGQKEKLAYTILAAALAYQFGLQWGETRSRSFRFVMIDEAFGRGSDESARYGLELFQKLNLQLLIVTPMQKIHVIENYVKTVNFVHNDNGQNSMLRNLTISDYQQEKATVM